MDQVRKAILGDPTILWPGTTVKILSGLYKDQCATVIHSKYYGKEYGIVLNSGATITVEKQQIKEI